MAGITDAPFRALASRFGAGLVVSEMVASEDLIKGRGDAARRAKSPSTGPHMVQLAGRDAYWMGEAARLAEGNGADIIDINMGCPAKRVTTGLCGAALLRDLDQAMRLIEAVVAATTRPVTLKTRLGWDEGCLTAEELGQRAQEAGIQMLTIHGRTRCQFYKGRADWPALRRVRDKVTIPLVVNGDITSLAAARRALAQSAADAVMVGRGAQGQPWIVGEIGRALWGKAPAPPFDLRLLADVICEHYEAILGHYGVELGVRCARKHLNWYWRAHLPANDAQSAERRRSAMMTEVSPKRVLKDIQSAFSDLCPRLGDGAAETALAQQPAAA